MPPAVQPCPRIDTADDLDTQPDAADLDTHPEDFEAPEPRRAPAPPLSPRLLRRNPPKPRARVAPLRLSPRVSRPLPTRLALTRLPAPRFRLPLRRGGR